MVMPRRIPADHPIVRLAKPQFMPPRIGDVLVHVAARVDHDRRAGGLVSDEIRGLGKAVEVVLHKTHPSSRAFASDDLSVLSLVRVPDYRPKT